MIGSNKGILIPSALKTQLCSLVELSGFRFVHTQSHMQVKDSLSKVFDYDSLPAFGNGSSLACLLV